jgi:hypothetical protein
MRFLIPVILQELKHFELVFEFSQRYKTLKNLLATINIIAVSQNII